MDAIHVDTAVVHAVVSGPFAEADVARAQAKADLWDRLFYIPFFYSTQEPVDVGLMV